MLQPVEHPERLVDDIGHALERHPAAPALGARVRALRHQPGAGLGADLAGERQPVLAQRAAGQQQQRRLARAQHPRRLARSPPARRRRRAAGGTATGPEPSFHAVSAGRIRVAICPGGVRAAAIAAAPSAAIDIASGEVLTQCEIGLRQPLDVGGQRRVVLPVIGRVVADDVDHARRRLVGVVDIGGGVGEAGPQMQQASPPGFSLIR